MKTPPRRLALILGIALAGAAAAGAQETPTLGHVEELLRSGWTAEARDDLARWWSESYANADRAARQRALWLRGRLTLDPVRAIRDFQRLVIEFPGGMFSDAALFRLAQGAHASGDTVRARAYLNQLSLDYPTSPVRRAAEAWWSSAGPPGAPSPDPSRTEGGIPERTGDRAREGSPAGGADTVTGGAGATRAAGASPGDRMARMEEDPVSPPASDTPTVAAEVANEPGGRYSVQLGAFVSEARARAHLERVVRAGLEARLVRVEGSRLFRVRVGRFEDAAAADSTLGEVQRRGFVAVAVRDAHKEERVR